MAERVARADGAERAAARADGGEGGGERSACGRRMAERRGAASGRRRVRRISLPASPDPAGPSSSRPGWAELLLIRLGRGLHPAGPFPVIRVADSLTRVGRSQ